MLVVLAQGLGVLPQLRNEARIRLCALPLALHPPHRLVGPAPILRNEEGCDDTHAPAHALHAVHEHTRSGVAECCGDECGRVR